VYAEGDKNTLEQFLQELKKGPYGATVDKIDTEWKTPGNQYKDFRITY
jgi:acylphosphatase